MPVSVCTARSVFPEAARAEVRKLASFFAESLISLVCQSLLSLSSIECEHFQCLRYLRLAFPIGPGRHFAVSVLLLTSPAARHSPRGSVLQNECQALKSKIFLFTRILFCSINCPVPHPSGGALRIV